MARKVLINILGKKRAIRLCGKDTNVEMEEKINYYYLNTYFVLDSYCASLFTQDPPTFSADSIRD